MKKSITKILSLLLILILVFTSVNITVIAENSTEYNYYVKYGGMGDGRSWFVVEKDMENNILRVCQGEDDPRLWSNMLQASQMTFIAGHAPAQEFNCTAKVRYRQPDQKCRVVMEGENARVFFEENQRAVTPGQSVVLYDGEICLGGGIIE